MQTIAGTWRPVALSRISTRRKPSPDWAAARYSNPTAAAARTTRGSVDPLSRRASTYSLQATRGARAASKCELQAELHDAHGRYQSPRLAHADSIRS